MMRRVILAILSMLILAGACATTNEDVYPDDDAIKSNAAKSHKELRKEEDKER